MDDALPLIVTAIVSIIASQGFSALLRLRHDKKIGVRTTDIAAAEQFDTAQDRLIKNLEARVEALTQRVNDLEAERRTDAQVIRTQGDHIDQLEYHIWSRKAPPPPARPAIA